MKSHNPLKKILLPINLVTQHNGSRLSLNDSDSSLTQNIFLDETRHKHLQISIFSLCETNLHAIVLIDYEVKLHVKLVNDSVLMVKPFFNPTSIKTLQTTALKI